MITLANGKLSLSNITQVKLMNFHNGKLCSVKLTQLNNKIHTGKMYSLTIEIC